MFTFAYKNACPFSKDICLEKSSASIIFLFNPSILTLLKKYKKSNAVNILRVIVKNVHAVEQNSSL